jgi:hypothetical protein
MSKDNELWAAIFGGLVGAAIASPKPEDKKDLEEYRKLRQEIQIRQQKIGIFPNYFKLVQKPEYYNAFIESFNTYSSGFFRSSVIISSALIESLLKEKYGNLIFADLIKKAGEEKIISEFEYHLLEGIRIQRNDTVHNILGEIREEDSSLILQITIRILNKLL